MKNQLKEDLKRHSKLAFRRMRDGASLLKRFHELSDEIKKDDVHCNRVYQWLSVPFSLWPVDIIGVADYLFQCRHSNKAPHPAINQLLEMLGNPPSEKTCNSISAHEHSVKGGSYETLIRAQHKFDFRESLLNQNPSFKADWKWIKSNFALKEFQGSNGVIRRRMVSERSFRTLDWNFQWRSKKDRFRNIFDAFCHKWALYGMQWDKPLLQKLSINVTPYGTMIFIPRYWSFDRHRDLRWRMVTRLHRSRGVSRQGEKLISNQTERRKQAEAARKFYATATKNGMKGEKRDSWVMAKLGLHPETDRKQLWRLIKLY